ncbi:MAG: pepsin/retropepsin-like aspartic protease family protein [Paraglaciecola sp.]|uniref:pepsin/retropepsin-like aspartic protease family protein n=1 Tax=Paraglaciecola sp. TaxID=1920173 RepID=UPI003296EDCD
MFLKSVTILFCIICHSLHAGVSEWVTMTLENGHMKFPVLVEGIETMAIVDSGAQINGLNESFKRKHNLDFAEGRPIKLVGVHGKENRPTYNGVSVEMFGLKTKLNSLGSINFGGDNSALVLGAGFLQNYIVQIDYPNEKMRFVTRDSMKLHDFVNVRVKSQKDTGRPIIKVNLNNQTDVWLLLDTGATSGVFLERSVASKNGWLDKYPVVSSKSQGALSHGATDTFSLPTFKIGPYELENVTVDVGSEGSITNVGSQVDTSFSRIKGTTVRGLLGYDVLKHFILTLDYKRGQAHLGLPPN